MRGAFSRVQSIWTKEEKKRAMLELLIFGTTQVDMEFLEGFYRIFF
jgi:hypothetical protein